MALIILDLRCFLAFCFALKPAARCGQLFQVLLARFSVSVEKIIVFRFAGEPAVDRRDLLHFQSRQADFSISVKTDRKITRLNSSYVAILYAVFVLYKY